MNTSVHGHATRETQRHAVVSVGLEPDSRHTKSLVSAKHKKPGQAKIALPRALYRTTTVDTQIHATPITNVFLSTGMRLQHASRIRKIGCTPWITNVTQDLYPYLTCNSREWDSSTKLTLSMSWRCPMRGCRVTPHHWRPSLVG